MAVCWVRGSEKGRKQKRLFVLTSKNQEGAHTQFHKNLAFGEQYSGVTTKFLVRRICMSDIELTKPHIILIVLFFLLNSPAKPTQTIRTLKKRSACWWNRNKIFISPSRRSMKLPRTIYRRSFLIRLYSIAPLTGGHWQVLLMKSILAETLKGDYINVSKTNVGTCDPYLGSHNWYKSLKYAPYGCFHQLFA